MTRKFMKIKLYRNHGLAGRDLVKIFGVNSRLDVITAEIIILDCQIKSVIKGKAILTFIKTTKQIR